MLYLKCTILTVRNADKQLLINSSLVQFQEILTLFCYCFAHLRHILHQQHHKSIYRNRATQRVSLDKENLFEKFVILSVRAIHRSCIPMTGALDDSFEPFNATLVL
jgi:hypothetical protein